jgi:hypothetical protein
MDCLDNRSPALLRGFLVFENVYCLGFVVWGLGCLVLFGVWSTFKPLNIKPAKRFKHISI